MPACHLVYRSCPEAWLSFVYPTGANAVKFAGKFGLSSCRRQLHLNLSESLTADSPARGRGHEHSAHVSQWGGSGYWTAKGNLNDIKSILIGTEASIVFVRRGLGARMKGRVPEHFERCQMRSGVSALRTTVTRALWQGSDGAQDGKLHGRGANDLLDSQNFVSNGGKTAMVFLSGVICRRHDTIVSTAGHYKVSEGP